MGGGGGGGDGGVQIKAITKIVALNKNMHPCALFANNNTDQSVIIVVLNKKG